jgi:hypothetical protein
MSENLYLPELPASPLFIGDDDKVMTIEWQEFFRILFDRVGGIVAPSITESSIALVADLFSTPRSYSSEIGEGNEESEAEAYFFGTVL